MSDRTMLSAELSCELNNNTEKLFALLARSEYDVTTGTCEITVGNFRKLKKYLKNLKRLLANARTSIINSQDVAEELRSEALAYLNIIESSTVDVQCLLSEWDSV